MYIHLNRILFNANYSSHVQHKLILCPLLFLYKIPCYRFTFSLIMQNSLTRVYCLLLQENPKVETEREWSDMRITR